MAKIQNYTVCYCTGAGDFAMKGTLEEVKNVAKKRVSFTEENVIIGNEEGRIVSVLYWHNYPYEPKGNEQDNKVVFFGTEGFYKDWEDWA